MYIPRWAEPRVSHHVMSVSVKNLCFLFTWRHFLSRGSRRRVCLVLSIWCLRQPGDLSHSSRTVWTLSFFFRGGGCFYLKWLRAAGLPKHSARVESKPGRCRGSDGATELHKLSLPSPAEVGQQNIKLLQSASSWTPTSSTNFACKRGGAVLVEASDPFLLSHSYSVWCRRTQIINILSTSLVIHWNLPTFALL